MLEVVLEVAREDRVDLGMLFGQARGSRAKHPRAVADETKEGRRGHARLVVHFERVVDRRDDVPA
jgi:hypothetical protein